MKGGGGEYFDTSRPSLYICCCIWLIIGVRSGTGDLSVPRRVYVRIAVGTAFQMTSVGARRGARGVVIWERGTKRGIVGIVRWIVGGGEGWQTSCQSLWF